MVDKDLLQPEDAAENVKEARKQWGVIALLSVVVTFAIFMMIAGYAVYGEDFVRRRDDSVGDMLMREAKRIEAGGLEAHALETYERALKARFNGAENRTFTLERAGVLQWRAGNIEQAVAYLSRALEGAGASLTPYEGLVDSLIQLDRLDEARQRLSEWEEALDGEQDKREIAKVCYASGVLEEAEGDDAAAMGHYERCVTQHECALSAARLGALYYEKGNREKALHYLDAYFLHGAPRQDDTELYALYSRLVRLSDL